MGLVVGGFVVVVAVGRLLMVVFYKLVIVVCVVCVVFVGYFGLVVYRLMIIVVAVVVVVEVYSYFCYGYQTEILIEKNNYFSV